MTHPEVKAEQAYIDFAYERLEVMRERARSLAQGVLVSSPGGTHQARFTRDVIVENSYRRLAGLTFGDEPLVFGRIDRVDTERFYIGRVAVADENQEPVVVDWRADVAEPFYRATGRSPMGVRRRRHFLCRGQQLLGIDDELLDASDNAEGLVLVGEGALLAALDRPRAGRMRDIVATIQGEQDEIIRAPLEGMLVVQGGPGTGKTVVALHRAAYLLYTHRRRLERGGVLLVGPNPIFLRYIEQVLPSLGEQTVKLATPSSLVPGITVNSIDSPEAARIKGDLRMTDVLKNALADRERGPGTEVSIRVESVVVRIPSSALQRTLSRLRRNDKPHNAKRAQFERSLLKQLHRSYRSALRASVAAGETSSEALRPGAFVESEEDERREFFETVRSDPKLLEAADKIWPVISPDELVRDLLSSRDALESAARGILKPHEIDHLHRKDVSAGWTAADAALIDEALVLVGRAEKVRSLQSTAEQELDEFQIDRVLQEMEQFGLDPLMRESLRDRMSGERARQRAEDEEEDEEGIRTYAYALVDEAQDLSPIQWRTIARRCPSGAMTVVGDLGQASREWAPVSWDEAVRGLEVRAKHTVKELTVNYRTPAEIMHVAASILAVSNPGETPPRSVRSTGESPLVLGTSEGEIGAEAGAAAASMAERVGDGKVAVIGPSSMRDKLRLAIPPSLLEVEPGGSVLDARVACLTVDESKGLEFDGVVLVEPATIVEENPVGLRALYVALTRAMKYLVIVHAQPLPEALKSGLESQRVAVPA